jgi:hypothetical protein
VVSSTIIFLSLAASALALWTPSRSDGDPQQLRNFSDILKVDSFRSTPTPTPTPAPTPPADFVFDPDDTKWSTWNSSYLSHDTTPHPHPLVEFFGLLSARYRGVPDYGIWAGDTFGYLNYRRVGRSLHPAGNAIENLVTERGGPKRFLRARAIARAIEAAANSTTESYGFDYSQNPYSFRGNTAATRTDYCGLALAFASDLRKAVKNAAAHRPLTSGLPVRRHKLQIIVTYARNGYPIHVVRTNGRGGSTVTALSAPPVSDYDYGSGGATTSSGTLKLGGSNNSTPTPTPTPSH